MNIVFRVDSSVQIGSGHLMRCLTLAKRYRKEQQANIFFIMRALDGNMADLIIKNNFKVISLPKMEKDSSLKGYEKWLSVKGNVDAQQTINEIKKINSVELLVIDHYAIDEAWESLIRSYVKKIMVIDDLANRKHDCDILLDQNSYLDKDTRYRGLVPENCKLLLGAEHAILREEFYEAKKHQRKRDGVVRNIMIFFGGSDPSNETMKALHAFKRLNRSDIIVNVIVGGSNQHKGEVEKYCQQYKNINYYCQVDNMADFMNEADLAIGAGGTTTWERCFLNLPAIVIAIAENQVKICEDCAKQGYITYLGRAEMVDVDCITYSLKQFI